MSKLSMMFLAAVVFLGAATGKKDAEFPAETKPRFTLKQALTIS